MVQPDVLAAAWIPNRGAACTTAAVLAALGALGAAGLPALEEATLALGAREALGAPALLDYVSLPGRRASLDVRLEKLAAAHGLGVRSRSTLVRPAASLQADEGELVVANLAWGQERPGRYGTWGWNPLRPATYSTGGHSVVLAETAADHWLVLDPNHPGLQRWPHPGLAVTATRIRKDLNQKNNVPG